VNTTAINWDQWRADYDRMSFADHQAFNQHVATLHPEQRSYNVAATRQFLKERQPRTVVEIGGWDGALADLMIDEFYCIKRWTNYDITDVPQACDAPAYERVVLDDWPWNRTLEADALIASHVLEHMKLAEVAKLLNVWSVDSVYVDCPIGGGTDWAGYHGTHILEASVTQLLDTFHARGFETSYAAPGLIAYLDKT
jgi:hypothetical protein